MKKTSLKINKSWELFFESETKLSLTDEELLELNTEYPLFSPSMLTSEEKQKRFIDTSNDELDAIILDMFHVEGIEENEEDIQSLPLCCKKNCLKTLTEREIADRHSWMKQMTKREQDIYLLSQLLLGKTTKEQSVLSKRTRFLYRFDNARVLCRNAFLFVHGIKIKRLKRLQALASNNILLPFLHRNTHKIPAHALCKEDVEKIVKFISNYGSIHGLPDPGRLKRNTREILLPRSDTFISIWKSYKNSLIGKNKSSTSSRIVGYDSFRQIWKQRLPHIKFIDNKTDLCARCEELKNSMKYANSLEQLQNLINNYDDHYKKTQEARNFYNKQIELAEKDWQNLPKKTRLTILQNLSSLRKQTIQKTCSKAIRMHYSFDFAQQVFYPYSNQQIGKEYFKTARKCQIFGVCAEALPRQVFFLIDESEYFGKGSKMVISLLDAFFNLHGLGEIEANLHADNCTGQNKNNYVIWYLMWRVMNGLHKKITLSFMVPGHTKFSPDRYFGLLKIKYRRSNIDCLHDLVNCVEESTINGSTIPQIYGQHFGLEKNQYEYRDWNKFLSKYFRPLNGILQYNYFTFDNENPGIIYFKENPNDSFKSQNLLKDKYFEFPAPLEYPPEEKPDGLSEERKVYLYNEIREFIRDPKKRDLTCPKL